MATNLVDHIQFNKRYQVATDPNLISDSGIAEIKTYMNAVNLRNPDWKKILPPDYDPYDYQKERLPALPDEWEWVAKSDGKKKIGDQKYAGRFTRRYSQFVYKNSKISCPVDWLEKMGNIVSSHSEKNAGYSIDFTKDLYSWRSGEFGDDGSCFWAGRATARDIMTKHGVFAIRFYRTADADSRGLARAWVVPNVPEQGMLTVFNGYGFTGDATRTIVRVLAQHLELVSGIDKANKEGIHYREVRLRNNHVADGTLYINGGRCFIVGDAEICKKYTEIDLKWKERIIGSCSHCDTELYEGDDYESWNGRRYCQSCFDELFTSCSKCGMTLPMDDIHALDDDNYCDACYNRMTVECGHCHDRVLEDEAIFVDGESEYVCEGCSEEEITSCTHCDTLFYTHNLTEIGEDVHGDAIIVCEVCAADLAELEEA